MPVEVRCRCGQVLSVPEESSGRTIACRSCGAAVFVGRPRSMQAERRSPPPSARTQDARCPNCNSILMPGAVLCPICGLDLRTGRVLLREFGERRKLSPGAILGPLGALAIVAGAVWLWRSGALQSLAGKSPRPREKEGRAAAEAANTAARQEKGPVPAAKKSGTSLRGGAISGTVQIGDIGRPHVLGESLTIPAGSSLRIGKGSSIVGEGGAVLSLAGGELVIEGTSSEPVLVAIPLVAPGPESELRVQGALFSRDVSLAGLSACRVERSTFMAGLRLEPAEPARRADWTFEHCEFRQAPRAARADDAEARQRNPTLGAPSAAEIEQGRACIEVRNRVPRGKLGIVVRRSNILGKVAGVVGAGSRLELVRNYWQAGPEEAFSRLERRGDVAVEPAELAEIEGAGASDRLRPQDVLARAGLLAPEGEGGSVLDLPALGLRIERPEGWRPVGEGVLVAPDRFPLARIQIELRTGDPHPVRVRIRMVSELGSGGAQDVRASEGEIIQLGEREAFDFTCTFRVEDERWARRCIVVNAGRDAYVFTLSARESDLPKLGGALLAVVRSMRIVGKIQ